MMLLILKSKTGDYIFCDCWQKAQKAAEVYVTTVKLWKLETDHKPADSVIDMAVTMGIELLNENQYRALQKLGTFDVKTSSWLKTRETIRKLGGAIFGDYGYDTVFEYHNGAQSYYTARGFRGLLRI